MSENRKKIYEEYHGIKNPFMARTFLTYDRYSEAKDLEKALKAEIGPDFKVLDYGSGVGDHGMTFLRAGCHVSFFDYAEFNDFVEFRAEKEQYKPKLYNAAFGNSAVLGGDTLFDFVIFGEVLEHLPDPLSVLKAFQEKGTRYIFTSSYPYRRDDDEDYWNHEGHDHTAREQQPACREILENRYKKVANFGGQLNLWKLRS